MLEQKNFIKSIHPFEFLTKNELDMMVESIDIAYFKENEIIQDKLNKPQFLYFIIKGVVKQKSENEVVSFYAKGEIFQPISLIENLSKHTFVASEECICYMLPREIFIKILHENSELERYFFQSISEKLNSNINYEKNRDLANIMLSKVSDVKLHKAVIKSTDISIFGAVKIIKDENIPTLLLQDEKHLYIVTDSDFRQKVILNRMDFDEKVVNIASKDIVFIYEDEFLFNAQLTMTKHGIKRVVVKDKQENIIGILDQISLSSFFATNTFIVTNQIENARSVEELKSVSASFMQTIKGLNAKGVKIEFITKLINQLNKNLLHKLYSLLAPDELKKHSSLIVMGSEGRGEQILKTDQDNGIILSDECNIDEKTIREFSQEFTKTLVEFGFPTCKGNIMVSNPYWCKSFSEYKNSIYQWVNSPNENSFINIAIFYDAISVYGDKAMVIELKKYLFSLLESSTFYAHFAKIISSFDVPLGFFDGFIYDAKNDEHKHEIDIKKGGIFILIHGIRSLALEQKVLNANTLKRIRELKKAGVFDEEFSKELVMAFNFLLQLKLKSNLEKLQSKKEPNNYINPKHLTTMEKDLLKDAFKIVGELKKKIEYHFRLNYV